MKNRAQLICTVVFIAIVIKSFVTITNTVDVIALIAATGIYCMYEFLTEQRTIKRFNLYKKETNSKLEDIQRDIDGTKNKISSIHASQALRR